MLDARAMLAKLDLTEAEIDVYLMVLKGVQSAREIISATTRSRPTVYYALTALERRGLITRSGNSEEYRYQAEPLTRLKAILQAQEDTLAITRTQLEEFMAIQQEGDRQPQVVFYEGLQADRGVILESLYCRSGKIDSIVPSDNFFWQLGSDFVDQYTELNYTLGISTRNLWDKSIKKGGSEEYYRKTETRILPDSMRDKFNTTVFIYDDLVLNILPRASGYAFVVRSREHSEMMRVFYETLWGLGKSY